jgi:hypothetical protein
MGFREYVDNKEVEVLMERGARLFERSSVEPEVFIEEFVKQYGLSEDWNDFWSGVKNRAAQAWDAVKNFGPVKAGTNAVNRALSDKYTRSINALKDLHQFLGKSEQARSVFSKNKTDMRVTDYIGELINSLQRETDIAYLVNGVERNNQSNVAPNPPATNAAAAPATPQSSRFQRPQHGGYTGR